MKDTGKTENNRVKQSNTINATQSDQIEKEMCGPQWHLKKN